MDLRNKVALVTGSSSGIGRSIALGLASKGAKVIVTSRKNIFGGEDTVHRIKDKGGIALYLKADLTKEKEVVNLFRKSRQVFSSVDILVNNAGESRGGEFGDIELWKFQFENILMSQVIATREFLTPQSSKLRKIVNISSIYGSAVGGNTDYIAYSAAKAGVNSMTVNLAKKLRGKVLVNAVSPGWTWTDPWGNNRKESEKGVKGHLPINRFVEASEISHMVISILENDAMTGQIITVDGGATLKNLI